jgi:hypothetical protein
MHIFVKADALQFGVVNRIYFVRGRCEAAACFVVTVYSADLLR